MPADAVAVMKDLVFSQMKKQEDAGKLSLAHGYDHVGNVSEYAGIFAPYFGRRLGVKDPERLAPFARMAGFSHDVIRYASETESGEDASAEFLDSQFDSAFSPFMSREEYRRFVVEVVKNSKENFARVMELYKDDPEVLAVALAVTAGDKLIEASGPRVLERRSFFVGGERMRNPKDLGAVFRYPQESFMGVLTETMVRLGDVNHVSNYATFPPLLDLAQELHVPQYQWYVGLLRSLGMFQKEALGYFLSRLRSSAVTEKLAGRVEKGGRRLIEEGHVSGKYFEQSGLHKLSDAVESALYNDSPESSLLLVGQFATAETPEKAIEAYEKNPFGPDTFKKWMGEIAEYRRGDFGKKLVARLEASK